MRFTTPLALVFGLAATVAAVPQYEDQHLLSNFYNMVDHKGRGESQLYVYSQSRIGSLSGRELSNVV